MTEWEWFLAKLNISYSILIYSNLIYSILLHNDIPKSDFKCAWTFPKRHFKCAWELPKSEFKYAPSKIAICRVLILIKILFIKYQK